MEPRRSDAEQLNAACDECRERKLKCSGELPICHRCAVDNVHCVYSPRKKMGRPRKRRRSSHHETASEDRNEVILHAKSNGSFSGVSPDVWESDADLAQHVQPHVCIDVSATNSLCTESWQMSQQGSLDTPSTTSIDSGPLGIGSCNCISMMTNILEQLRLLKTFQFPLTIGLLRNAISAVKLVITCHVCPDAGMTALQNVTLLQAVLFSLVDRFNALFKSMSAEADRLAASDGTKEMRIADPNDSMTMHTGTPDCPAGLVIQVQAAQWREMCKAALAKLLHGSDSSISSLLDCWEARQRRWHADQDMLKKRQEVYAGARAEGDGTQPGGCISTINRVREQVRSIPI